MACSVLLWKCPAVSCETLTREELDWDNQGEKNYGINGQFDGECRKAEKAKFVQ